MREASGREPGCLKSKLMGAMRTTGLSRIVLCSIVLCSADALATDVVEDTQAQEQMVAEIDQTEQRTTTPAAEGEDQVAQTEAGVEVVFLVTSFTGLETLTFWPTRRARGLTRGLAAMRSSTETPYFMEIL